MNTHEVTKITVLGHACVLLEVVRAGRTVRILVDPGNLTPALDEVGVVDAVLVTHDHPDHLDPEQIDRLRLHGPLKVFGPVGIAGRLALPDSAVTIIESGSFEIAGIEITCIESTHETIYPGVPLPANLGYLIGGVFVPGDALSAPDSPLDVLLAPIAGPWMKLSEGIDFVRHVAPRAVIPIHDGGLAAAHQALHRALLGRSLPAGTELRIVNPGETTVV